MKRPENWLYRHHIHFDAWFLSPSWSAEAKWHIPCTKILNPLKQREGGKDSPNKLSRVNASADFHFSLTDLPRL